MKTIYTFNQLILILFLSSFTYNVFGQCVNLTHYQPSGWDNKIVISAVTGTNTSESHFYENQTLYIDFSVVNNGTCTLNQTFKVNLFLDGVFKNTFTLGPLTNGFQISQPDFLIAGTLAIGNHTIQIDIDSPSLISETNESDNTVYRTFTVEQGSCVSTPVSTVFNGNQNFNTEHYLNTNFRVKDQCNTATIRVRDFNSTTTSSTNPLEITSPTNSWTTNNQRFAGSTMWAAKSAYNYYSAVHSRASYNNSNGPVEGYINAVFNNNGTAYTDNASMSFTGGTMFVGLGSSGTLPNSWCPLDIIAHEYTHAVTGSSAALAYQNESGALNESFSDIFGECVENYITGSNDWLFGANRTSGALRSMSNPKAYNQPNTYLGTNWYTGTGDNGGVHYNSGVQNYWFYLLSQGGSGTNDNSYAYSIIGLGIAKARAIAYKTLAVILFNKPNTTYNDAKLGSIQAAEDLYGVGSTEANTVKSAWCAVGVGTCSCTLPLAVNVTGGGTFCNSTNISASGGSGGTIYWQGTTSNGTSTVLSATSIPINTSGTYYFRAFNTCGWGSQGSVTVTINTVPSAVSVSGGGTFCNGTTISATGGSGGTIYWQGTTSGGTSFATAATTQGVSTSGTYYFRAYNACGWGNQGSATVTINTVPSAVSVSGGGTFCNGTTISATGGSGGTIYWQGTTNGGTSFATAATTQGVSTSGTYYFRAYNACGWGSQGSVTLTINTIPAAVSVSGGGTFCNGTTISATGGSGGTIYWQGTTNGGTSFATAATTQGVSTSGTYYFRSYNSCGWGTQGSVTLTINTTETVSVYGGGTFCNSANLSAFSSSGGTIYWQSITSGGTSTTTPITSQITVGFSGTHYFRVLNSCGWGPEGSAIVTIIPSTLPLSGTATSGIQIAGQTITSTQNLPSGTNVSYQAGNSITLQGLFNAQSGSVFKAEIKGCTN